MRIKLKGINVSRKRIASGEVVTYYYAWRGGPRIDAKPGTPEFVRLFQEAHAQRRQPAPGTLFSLLAEFRASAEFAGRAPSTRRAYAHYLRAIEDEFGAMPIAALSDPRVRGVFMQWRDGLAQNRRAADYAWTTLARVLSFAKNRGRIAINPCERGGRLYSAERNDNLWGEAEIARMLSVAGPEMELALMLALWTGQRQGDLLRLRWSDYDGAHIRLRQSKTGQSVVIPIAERPKELLARAPRGALTILTNKTGKPWTSDGFRASWRKLCARAGVSGLTFHDLRGSAVTRLSIAGATPQEVAGVTGHSIVDVCGILDRHYLGDRPALAEAAMRKLEAGTKTANRRQTGALRIVREGR